MTVAKVYVADIAQSIGSDTPVLDQLDTLDQDERQRAQSFHNEEDRRRFVLSHLMLRDVLERHTGTRGQALRFARGVHGKPMLSGGKKIFFNLSHSGERALIAISHDGEIGVDVERLRPLPNAESLAQVIASDEEIQLLDLTEWRQLLRLWVRKEAVLKATGEGLSRDPRTVTLSDLGNGRAIAYFGNGGKVDVVDIANVGAPAPSPSLEKYVAAIASPDPILSVRVSEWQFPW